MLGMMEPRTLEHARQELYQLSYIHSPCKYLLNIYCMPGPGGAVSGVRCLHTHGNTNSHKPSLSFFISSGLFYSDKRGILPCYVLRAWDHWGLRGDTGLPPSSDGPPFLRPPFPQPTNSHAHFHRSPVAGKILASSSLLLGSFLSPEGALGPPACSGVWGLQ